MQSSESPTARELSDLLLDYEKVQANPATLTVSRVCDKLRLPLTTLVGAVGYRSLLNRALTLAKQESQVFAASEITSDGSLAELSEEAVQSSVVLVAHLIGLLITFIGHSLTMRLVQDVWVDLPLLTGNSERKQSK